MATETVKVPAYNLVPGNRLVFPDGTRNIIWDIQRVGGGYWVCYHYARHAAHKISQDDVFDVERVN